MGKPLKIYKPLTLASSGTLWLLQVLSLLLYCFIFKPLHFITSLDSCHLHTLSTPAPQLLTPQALTYPRIPQRAPSPWLPTFLSLYPLLPLPSYVPSHLSQSQAPTQGTDTEVPRCHPSLSCCVPSPGVSVLGQGWRGQGEEELLGLCKSSWNPSPLHQRRQLLYQSFGF